VERAINTHTEIGKGLLLFYGCTIVLFSTLYLNLYRRDFGALYAALLKRESTCMTVGLLLLLLLLTCDCKNTDSI
jgi:hypothetical protein